MKPSDAKAGPQRRTSPRFQGAAFDDNLGLVGKMREIAEAKGRLPGQLAPAWVLAQGENVVPIPGTKKVRDLEENVASLDITLSEDKAAAIRRAMLAGGAAGERYAPEGMRALSRRRPAPARKPGPDPAPSATRHGGTPALLRQTSAAMLRF